jgi:hypothetical protein
MRIQVDIIRQLCDPFIDSPLNCNMRRAFVQKCIDADLILEVPIDSIRVPKSRAANIHASRIAYFCKNPEKIDAISLDVGVPVLGHSVDWIIVDGNHRFAAAIFMGIESLDAEISGQMDYAYHLLGITS